MRCVCVELELGVFFNILRNKLGLIHFYANWKSQLRLYSLFIGYLVADFATFDTGRLGVSHFQSDVLRANQEVISLA